MQLTAPIPHTYDPGGRLTSHDFAKAAQEAIEARENQKPHCVRECDNSGYRPGRSRS